MLLGKLESVALALEVLEENTKVATAEAAQVEPSPPWPIPMAREAYYHPFRKHCVDDPKLEAAAHALAICVVCNSGAKSFESQQSQQRELGSQCETSTGKQRALAAIADACVQSSGVHAHTRSREAADRKHSLLDELHAGLEMINQLRLDMSFASAQHKETSKSLEAERDVNESRLEEPHRSLLVGGATDW
eukprot:gene26771-4352_t